jgi:acetyltransferase-like isoleucine patch superfamily enzyme
MARDSRNSAATSPFDDEGSAGRRFLRSSVNALAIVATLPLALPAMLERAVSPTAEGWFQLSAQLLAGVPGHPGVWLRRAYYWWTLEQCSLRIYIGYGAYFSHRSARLSDHVYIGPYAVIGSADLRSWALIGTRTSILSGGSLHQMDSEGRWLPSDYQRARRVVVGDHAWIGEGAILMDDIGCRAMVAAGAVVASPVADGVMVAGNPARFVRHLTTPSAVSEVR